jgi:hypothetical protein
MNAVANVFLRLTARPIAWLYQPSCQHRLARAALMQNNLWANDFLPRALPMIARMESALLNATAFSPLK